MSDEVRGLGSTESPETTDARETDEAGKAPAAYSDLENTETVALHPPSTEEFDDEASARDAPTPARRFRRDFWRRKVNLRPVAVVLIVLILISGGAAAWLYAKWYRPDQLTDPSVARAAVNAASDGTVALLSYSSDTLDRDIAAARSHLGGDFLSYYDQFTQQVVVPAAKQKSLKTTAHVMRAAVSELRPGSAVVLLFVNQNTTTKDNTEPSMKPSTVLVNVTEIGGKWLITKFTPI
ncbi:hypothetical protein F0Q45_13770 [Mycobacterium simiae]|uniref:Twin-arginine translocation pathway signal n=1 Tax=Mycobacterium simiae TaxID=1784 RepID=A0A5B1BMR0_MYCSI|nr:hypothetical protein [Mycobacterium simiae]KAA1249686.1 hypothetical protein F0Q45_13770 [Mycobacterium simiae]